MLRLLGDNTPDWGFAPGPRWGTPVPQRPAPPSRISGPHLPPPNSGSLEPPLLITVKYNKGQNWFYCSFSEKVLVHVSH